MLNSKTGEESEPDALCLELREDLPQEVMAKMSL